MTELTAVVGDLLREEHFLYALAVGAVILSVFYAISRNVVRQPQGWALAYGVGILAVLSLVFSLDRTLLLTLLLLLIAGALIDIVGLVGDGRRRRLLAVGIAWSLLAMAILLFSTQVTADEDLWLQLTVPIWMVAILLGARSLGRSSLAVTVAPLLAVTVIGIWVTVPETDMIEAALGTVLPMAVVTLPPIRARSTIAGLALVVGLLAWLTVDGGAGRDAEIVAGLSSGGMLLLVPIVRLGRPAISRRWVLGAHLVFVIVVTRLVDWLPSTMPVVVALAVFTLVTLISLYALGATSIEEKA